MELTDKQIMDNLLNLLGLSQDNHATRLAAWRLARPDYLTDNFVADAIIDPEFLEYMMADTKGRWDNIAEKYGPEMARGMFQLELVAVHLMIDAGFNARFAGEAFQALGSFITEYGDLLVPKEEIINTTRAAMEEINVPNNIAGLENS